VTTFKRNGATVGGELGAKAEGQSRVDGLLRVRGGQQCSNSTAVGEKDMPRGRLDIAHKGGRLALPVGTGEAATGLSSWWEKDRKSQKRFVELCPETGGRKNRQIGWRSIRQLGKKMVLNKTGASLRP